MDGSLLKLLTFVIVLNFGCALLPEFNQVHTKFQFMHSFKGPYLTGSEGNIPFWNHGGSKSIIIKHKHEFLRDHLLTCIHR